jgi:hypothetical protein
MNLERSLSDETPVHATVAFEENTAPRVLNFERNSEIEAHFGAAMVYANTIWVKR